MERVKPSILLALMSNEQLLKLGFTQEEIDAGAHLPSVSGGVASSQIITDLTTAVATPLSANSTARMNAAAGPIEDASAMIKSCLLSMQEVAAKMNYLLGGSMIAPASLTAPVGGIITTGDDATLYGLLVGVFQLLK